MSILLQWSFIYTYFRPPVTLELYARTAGYDFRIEALAPDIHGATTTTAATINAISHSGSGTSHETTTNCSARADARAPGVSAHYTLCA